MLKIITYSKIMAMKTEALSQSNFPKTKTTLTVILTSSSMKGQISVTSIFPHLSFCTSLDRVIFSDLFIYSKEMYSSE